MVSRSITQNVTSGSGVPRSSKVAWPGDRHQAHHGEQVFVTSSDGRARRYDGAVTARAIRCTACGNLTRFDVTASRRTRAFHHYTVGGELSVEDDEVLDETVEEVACRWCGTGDHVEPMTAEPADAVAEDSDLSGPSVDPATVRSALERALEVARQGEAATPVVAAPNALARYLGFQKLSGPPWLRSCGCWTATTPFAGGSWRRRRPTTSAPRAGWPSAVPPAGRSCSRRSPRPKPRPAVATRPSAARRELQRSLDASERKRAQAEAELARHREENEATHEELAAVRRDRRQGEDALRAVERRAEELDQKLEDRETRLAEAQGAREAREHELAETQRRLREAQAEFERRPAPLVPGERSVDLGALREATSRLQRAAATLAKSVDGVLAEVPPEPVLVEGRATAAPARVPLPLPGGMVADTVEGARWLLARSEVVLLVDGYNVAKAAWPDDDLEAQRARLVRTLDELATRTGATAEIVFDGPEDAATTARQSTRTVGVRYSGGALADDVVVDLVDAYPVDRPVVVVSSDREVRDAARAKVATVIGSDTLIAVFAV